MAYTLQYFDEVEKDVNKAKKWYKKEKEGQEVEFASEIENAIYRILESPQIFAIRYKKVRIAHPKIFPYNIHFYIDESNNKVVIIAIVHGKRKSGFLNKRLKNK